MKRVRCPKCDNYITFDETQYSTGQQLVFQCEHCSKQFAIRLGTTQLRPQQRDEVLNEREGEEEQGSIVVVENCFHFKQVIPLKMGDNVIGRKVLGTNINTPIDTVDPSVDTKHCIIRVSRKPNNPKLIYTLRDATSTTGTFFMNEVLKPQDRIRLEEGSIITIGATTLILRTAASNKEE